ncbi:MAG: oligosaccharide flippase family protein, partial [Candidatus Krumholzibacteriota bacterium]|nr:oligosaccharide flippase family protein [Candidatus Krumholzibacteriota bacterium]
PLIGGIFLFATLSRAFRMRYRPTFAWSGWRAHLRESVHFTISGGLMTLSQILPIIYLGIFATAYEVGLFSAPYRLFVAATFVISVLPMSLYPVFAELFTKNPTKFKKLLRLYKLTAFVSGLAILLGGILLAEDITLFVFGDQYRESALYLKIIFVNIFLHTIRSPYGIVIAATGLQKLYTIGSGTGVVLLATMIFVLRHIYGLPPLVSVSISFAFSEFIVTMILIFLWGHASERAR